MTDIIALHSVSSVGHNENTTNINSNSTEIHNDDTSTIKQRNRILSPIKISDSSQSQAHKKNANRGGNFHIGGSPQVSRKENKKTKQIRVDNNGVEINKKNKKKVKISFIDAISMNQLITIISVDNYKEYNYVSMPSLEDINVKSKSTCACVIY